MVRIGVISDTHGSLPDEAFAILQGALSDEELSSRVRAQYTVRTGADGMVEAVEEVGRSSLPAQVAELESVPVDLVIHAGDIGSQSVLDELCALGRTLAVLGNCDYEAYYASDGFVRDFRTLDFAGITIAVQHIPQELGASLHGRGTLQMPLVPCLPQLAIHGHTHIPKVEAQRGYVLLCPGSPTRARNGRGHTLALVDVEQGRIERISLIALD